MAPERLPVRLNPLVGEVGGTAEAGGLRLLCPSPAPQPGPAPGAPAPRPAPGAPTRRESDFVALTEAEKQPRYTDARALGRCPQDSEGRATLPPTPHGWRQPHPTGTQLPHDR